MSLSQSNEGEKDKLLQTKPGERVTIEGEIEQVKEGRFVYIGKAFVDDGS